MPALAVAFGGASLRKLLVTNVQLGAIAGCRDYDDYLGLKARVLVGWFDVLENTILEGGSIDW